MISASIPHSRVSEKLWFGGEGWIETREAFGKANVSTGDAREWLLSSPRMVHLPVLRPFRTACQKSASF